MAHIALISLPLSQFLFPSHSCSRFTSAGALNLIGVHIRYCCSNKVHAFSLTASSCTSEMISFSELIFRADCLHSYYAGAEI